MPKIVYDIIINSEGTIVGLKDVEKNEQILYDNMKYNTAEAKKQIDSLNASISQEKVLLDQLWNSYKKGDITYKQYADQANTSVQRTEDLATAADALNQVHTKTTSTVVSVGKAFSAVGKIIGKVTIVIGIIVAAFNLLKRLVSGNQAVLDKMTVAWAKFKAVTGVMIDNLFKFGKSQKELTAEMKKAADAAAELAREKIALDAINRRNILTIAELTRESNKFQAIMDDETKTYFERNKALQQYYDKEKQILDQKKEAADLVYKMALQNIQKEVDLTEDQILELTRLGDKVYSNNEFYKQWTKLSPEVKAAFSEAAAGIVEVGNAYDSLESSRMSAQQNIQTDLKDLFKRYAEAIAKDQAEANKEALERQKEFKDALLKLEDEYNKSIVEGMSGKEQIIAERNLQLAELAELEKFLRDRGKLTEDATNQLIILRDKYYSDAELALVEYDIAELAERKKTTDAVVKAEKEKAERLLDIQRETQEIALELLGDDQKARMALQIKFLEEDRAELSKRILNKEGTESELKEMVALYNQYGIKLNLLLKKQAEDAKEFSLSKLLGLTPEETDKLKEGLQFIADNVISTLSEISDARMKEAEKNVSLIEDQISQTQDALDREIELAKLGYANNVDAKKKELEELQKARAKALKEQQKAAKAQQQLDSVVQAVSLITASAQIIKDFSKIPVVGIPLAIAMIATMFGAFTIAKAKAAQLSKPVALAEGGYGDETGVVTGKRHVEGGEPFLKHVEVEKGEMWGVLNRNASQKYGKQFGQMVTSFNKDNLIIERPDVPVNNILVDVNQTNERLDRVEYQLIKLNRHFGGKREVHETPTVRIEKIGNKTRIIRK